MAYGDVWHCPVCGFVFVEDDAMWEDVSRCPKCGADLGNPKEIRV